MKKLLMILCVFIGVLLMTSSVSVQSSTTIKKEAMNPNCCTSYGWLHCGGCGYSGGAHVISCTFWEFLFRAERVRCPGCGRDIHSVPPVVWEEQTTVCPTIE